MRVLTLFFFVFIAGLSQAQPVEVFPAVILNRDAGHVDLHGHVIGDETDWLELLACRPGTREHESVVTLEAQAEHIHAALLLLGLEPGAPSDAQIDGDTVTLIPPHGPPLEVFFIFDATLSDESDVPAVAERPVPAGLYVADQAHGRPLRDARWIFTGSRMVQTPQRPYFLAEENGTLISLVNFGDDLVGRNTDQPADGGNGFWKLNPAPEGWPPLPPAGTGLTIRLSKTAITPDKDNALNPQH